MADAAVSFDDVTAQRASAEARHNDRSSIDFPYLDQDAAVEVAKAVYARAGRASVELDELAVQMGQTLSGTFRMKTAAARMFGFVEKDGRDKFTLTDIGHRIVNPESEVEARAASFLNVPLYKAIFEKYRGHLLPPPKALEREMALAGVAPKQVNKARQIFDRSARQAGFYTQAEDRLVQPRFDRTPETRPFQPTDDRPEPLAERKGGGGGGSGDNGGASTASAAKSVSEVLLAAFDPKDMDETQQEAVWTLLKYFKSKGI